MKKIDLIWELTREYDARNSNWYGLKAAIARVEYIKDLEKMKKSELLEEYESIQDVYKWRER
jgi:hypothetical protein